MGDTRRDEFSYDPFARPVLVNPIPYYTEMRANYPAYYVDKYDMFVFTRYQDIMDVLSLDNSVFATSETTVPTPAMISHRNDGAPPFPSLNPMAPGPTQPTPHYESLRLAHIRPLQPGYVRKIEDFVRGLVVDRLKLLLPRGKFDLLAEYGGMVSAAVTCHLFDIPLSETARALAIVNALASYDDEKQVVDVPAMFTTLKADFILPAVARRRAAGADGTVPLIDGLVHYRTILDGRALNDVEIADQLVCAFLAGTETPSKPSAQGLLALARRPDQLAAVRQDLAKNVPVAVEEMLRICTTAQWVVRTAQTDVTVAGANIKAGQRVLVAFFSASRDEQEFENADAFVWNRPIRRNLAFGYGQHHCIGNHMARLQMRLLVGEFLSRVSDYDFAMDEAEHSATYLHWGYTYLPVVIKEYAF